MKGLVRVSEFPGENTRRPMALFTALTVLVLLVAPDVVTSAESQSLLRVHHTPLACVTTSSTPNVTVAVTPEPEYAKGYVYFRATGEPDYYYAIMDGQPKALAASLPRPLPETKSIDYFVQAADRSQLTRRTPDYKPPVTDDKICLVSKKAVPAGGAGLTIGLTREGQNPVPPGFNKADIAKVILVTGAVVAVAAALSSAAGGGVTAAGAGAGASAGGAASGAAAGAGGAAGASAGAGAGAAAGGAAGAGAAGAGAAAAGGISTLAIVGIGAAAAVGVAVAAGGSGGGSSSPTPTFTPTPTPTPIPHLTFATATATWSGPGTIVLSVLKGGSIVQTAPQNCASQGSRTATVTLQGSSLTSGSYAVNASAVNCASQPTATSIAVVFSVLTSNGTTTGPVSTCNNLFKGITVGAAAQQVCTFNVP